MIDQQARVKEAYEAKRMVLNGRDYTFTATTHQRRRSVLAVFTKYAKALESVNLSVIEENDFKAAEKIISEIIMFDGMQVSKMPDHWEAFPEDYIEFLLIGMAVVCYPFLRGSGGA